MTSTVENSLVSNNSGALLADWPLDLSKISFSKSVLLNINNADINRYFRSIMDNCNSEDQCASVFLYTCLWRMGILPDDVTCDSMDEIAIPVREILELQLKTEGNDQVITEFKSNYYRNRQDSIGYQIREYLSKEEEEDDFPF